MQPPTAEAQRLPASPALDLTQLVVRLNETQAIGVFTKLTLKNQIDDLLDELHAHHLSGQQSSLAPLQRSYELLLLKVLALLQRTDPPLASAIAASREAIWVVLANPAQFPTVYAP